MRPVGRKERRQIGRRRLRGRRKASREGLPSGALFPGNASEKLAPRRDAPQLSCHDREVCSSPRLFVSTLRARRHAVQFLFQFPERAEKDFKRQHVSYEVVKTFVLLPQNEEARVQTNTINVCHLFILFLRRPR